MLRSVFRTVAMGLAVAGALLIVVQDYAAAKKRPATLAGNELFRQYCSSCHGADAKGTGVKAATLKTAPPDLTKLAERNDGKFPEDRLHEVISGDADISAHGPRTMPVWGSVFRAQSSDPQLHHKQISNLVGYLKQIQAK